MICKLLSQQILQSERQTCDQQKLKHMSLLICSSVLDSQAISFSSCSILLATCIDPNLRLQRWTPHHKRRPERYGVVSQSLRAHQNPTWARLHRTGHGAPRSQVRLLTQERREAHRFVVVMWGFFIRTKMEHVGVKPILICFSTAAYV